MADNIIKSLSEDKIPDKPLVEGEKPEEKGVLERDGTEQDGAEQHDAEQDGEEQDGAEKHDAEQDDAEQDDANLQLGDIIKLLAPVDERVNEKLFYISYIDNEKAVLSEQSGEKYIMHIEKDGTLRNKSIESIEIVSRPDKHGYARQNELLPGTWIDIVFGGDLPTIITGKITNLEEDQIEVRTSGGENIFLDFGYRGLPENIPIEKIAIREAPIGDTPIGDTPIGDAPIGDTPIGDAPIDEAKEVDDFTAPHIATSELQQQIRDVLLQADQIIIGDALEEISQVVDVPENEQRFGIEKQTSDLLDELLSTIPNHQRTETVLNNIHTMIERFKQLRSEYSTFDNNNNALLKKTHGAKYKPLVNKLQNLSQKLYWVLPVVQNKQKLYDIEIDVQEEFADIEPLTLSQVRSEEHDIIQQYRENDIPEGETGTHFLANSLNKYLTPYVNVPMSLENIIEKQVQTNIRQSLTI